MDEVVHPHFRLAGDAADFADDRFDVAQDFVRNDQRRSQRLFTEANFAIGSLNNPAAVDNFKTADGHDWTQIWIIPAVIAIVGVAYALSAAGVGQEWIIAAALILIGLGIRDVAQFATDTGSRPTQT